VSVELLVTSGTGPVEARRFVEELADALCRRLPVLARTTTGPEEAPVSVVLEVDGDAARRWVGTHTLHRRGERGRGRSEDERSQHRNRRRALERLAAALARRAEDAAGEARRERWLDRHRVARGAATHAWREERGELVEVG
jgi:protein subunit release factor B